MQTVTPRPATRERHAEELQRLTELRAQRPRGVLSRADYEVSLRRLGRTLSDGAVSGLRRELAARAPAAVPPAARLRFDDDVLAEMRRSTSLADYFNRVHGATASEMAFPSWYRAYTAQVDVDTRERVKAAMSANRRRAATGN